jgi:hypothetical protein
MREYRAAGRDKGRLRAIALQREFIGCDGEGGTLDNGYHSYFMLTIGTQTLRPAGNNVRLSTLECLDFISHQASNRTYVGYFFDYDATKILEDLPLTKLDRLIHRHKRTGFNGQLFPVDYGPYQLDYLPRKEFKVRHMVSQTETETVWSPWIVISDVGPFFQMAFLQALEIWKVGTQEEREQIRAGKQRRAEFNIAGYDDIALYNALEIRLLQQLMDRFREACVSAGYIPKKWQGPGQLAETMLQTHGVPKSKDVELLTSVEYQELLTFGRSAYYGGRFEVAHVGPVSVPIYQNDINSAYPHAMRYLPCLQHGKWQKEIPGRVLDTAAIQEQFSFPTGAKGETFAICYGSFSPTKGKRPLWYGLPIRTSTGNIVFPGAGKGWYWSFEIAEAIHQIFVCEEQWTYTRVCECRPLAFVEEVYEDRKRLGKDGPGIVLKLGLNSLYGKMVQSIGFPKYSNPIWGSFITAFPRAMIQQFIHTSPLCGKQGQCGKDIVMIATDSVASIIERKDIEISGLLGAWSLETHARGMFVVQPGVYFGTSGKPTKTRGFTRTIVDTYEDEFRNAFQRLVDTGDLAEGSVSLPIQTFVGIRYALQRKNLKLLGQWMVYGNDARPGKVLSFDWTSKRLPVALNPTKERPWILTLPYNGDPTSETVPYSKDIGALADREADRLAFADLPDWSPLGAIYD